MLSRVAFEACRASRLAITRRHPSMLAPPRFQCRTFKTTAVRRAAEEDTSVGRMLKDTGAVDGMEQSAMLYLDNLFPLRMSVFDIRQLFFRNTRRFLESRTNKAIPVEQLPHDVSIKEIIARTKDGGALVRFGFRSSAEDMRKSAKEIVAGVRKHLESQKVVAPFNLQPVRAFLVKGEPFLEDILTRYPTPRLRIEFQGEPISVERLYKHLRVYGRVYDITLYPNPYVSKDLPRYAIVQFTRVRAATSARSCLHGHTIQNTRLNILYERQLRTNVVKEWLVSHPRITVPVFAAMIAGITYVVFDPIRVFFITSKITRRFNPEEYAIYRWLRSETWDRLVAGHEANERRSVLADDSEVKEKLKSWLAETPETFVSVSGPKGSGKSALVQSSIDSRRHVLLIDCEDIANAHNKSEMTQLLAKQVGYYPVFTWVASMSSLIDTVVTATTGQKAGLSSSPDSQIKTILESVAVSLRNIAEGVEAEEQKSRHPTAFQRFTQWVRAQLGIPDDTIKQAWEEKVKGEDEIESEKAVPIIILDNFMYRENAKNAALWEDIAEWAALVVENELAHVVFVSANVGLQKILSKALPGKSFSTIMLSDAPPEVAMSYISRELGPEVVDDELHDIVAALGGRLTELELLVQKMRMDMDARSAFEDIVQRNVIEIRKYGFGDVLDSDNHTLEWSAIQFWEIVKRLTVNKSINYDELKWDAMFNGAEKPLRAMERAELITILQKDGRPNSIRPGKPVFYSVFDQLVSDAVFAASMEIETNMYLKKSAEESLAKFEETIASLSSINNARPPREIDTRIRYLLSKVASTQKAIEQYETRINEGKDIVSKAWKD